MAEVVSLQHIGNLYLFILLNEICFLRVGTSDTSLATVLT